MAKKKRNVTKTAVRKKMIALGVYKPEFDGTIDRYVELATEYATIYAAYVEGGYKCETETANGINGISNPGNGTTGWMRRIL